MAIYSFIFLMLMFVLIGALSMRKKTNSVDDYLLASRSMKPWVVALASCATFQSGFMFTGMIGATYFMGLSSAWILIGVGIGDYLAYKFLHGRFREFSSEHGFTSYSGLIANGPGKDFKILKFISAILIVVFLGTYAAAQLTAGSKALHVLFDWNYNMGAILGAFVVLLYCIAGGIRASMWVNVSQSFVMLIGMGILVVFALNKAGGFGELTASLNAINPEMLSILPKGQALYGIPYILGWIAAGIGVVGLPFVMVNYMTLNDSKNFKTVQKWYFSWTIVFYALTILAGLLIRVLLPDLANFDPELGLPTLSMELLPEILVGFVLASLFAGAVSTADSQIICCTASLTKDLCPKLSKSYLLTKLGTVIVIATVLAIALYGSKSVFSLVMFAIVVLESAFVPLVITYIFGYRPRRRLCLAMMFWGVVAMFVWRYYGYHETICVELFPGVIT